MLDNIRKELKEKCTIDLEELLNRQLWNLKAELNDSEKKYLFERYLRNIKINIDESIRGAHVYIIQSTSSPVNDHLMELLIMIDALKRIGLYSSPDDFRKYFPHAISHGLGSDVHESLGGYTEFMPGMILTVEPGIYIPEENIGIRIEDDILVTADGNENLSQALSTAL